VELTIGACPTTFTENVRSAISVIPDCVILARTTNLYGRLPSGVPDSNPVVDMVTPVGSDPEIILYTTPTATGCTIGPKFKIGTVGCTIGPKFKFSVPGNGIVPKFKFCDPGVKNDPKFIVTDCRIDPKFKFCVPGNKIVPMLNTGITGPVKLEPVVS
jgi:hypothetical protein